MHNLEAAMAAALLARRKPEGTADPDEIVLEGARGLVRLSLVVAVVAGFVMVMGVLSAGAPPEGPRIAIERTR